MPHSTIAHRTLTALLATLLCLAGCDEKDLRADPAAVATLLPAKPSPAPALDIAAREFELAHNRLGINLPPVFSWSNTPMYVDLMRQARRFGTPETPWDEKALLGEDGWPVGDFGVVLMSSQSGLSTNGGRYTVRFKGQAHVRLIATRGTLGVPVYDSTKDITTIYVDLPDRADQLILSFTRTHAPIKDLRVVRPGYDVANPPLFTHVFLEHIAPFKVVRLMDWLRTNNNPISHWALRASDTTTHYASNKGVPWEHIIELARVAGKDLWINIPAQADDDYVTNLATLLRDNLPKQTKLYVEYSNEVWNSMFSQNRENLAAAEREVETDPKSRLNHDRSNNKDFWRFRRIPQRGKEISDIFRSAFGDAEMMTRVRPVYATQIVNTYATELALDYMAKVHGPPNRYFYAIAGAPYYNLGQAQREENLDVDQVLAAMSESIDSLSRINRIEKNLALSHWYQLPFLAYEGGSDTYGPGSLAAKKAASLDPRMEGLCRRYLDNWYAYGSGLFMWFHAGAGKWDTPYGTWELTTDLAITDTPKIRCLNAALAAGTPAVKGRNRVPGRIEAIDFAGNLQPYTNASRDLVRHSRPGNHIDYLVQAAVSGSYRLTLHAGAQGKGNQIEVATGFGSSAGLIELADGKIESVVESPGIDIWLRAGLNTLRLKTIGRSSAGFDLRQIEIRKADS